MQSTCAAGSSANEGRKGLARSGLDPGNFLVGMIFVGYVLNFLDRQIVTVILEPIKSELQISDGKLGLLTGLGFAIFYATVGLPIAMLSDRFSRKKIIAACMALWSGATAVFGLAQTFPQMLLARMGVGIGEAGFAPAAFSMLADYFPKERRATAMAIASMGAMLGTTLGLGLGGYIAEHAGWRAAVLVAGAPGLVFSVAFLMTVKEPLRGLSGGAALVSPTEGRRVGELARNLPYVLVVLSATVTCFVMFACLHWLPTFLMRSYSVTGETAGFLLGPLLGAVGAVSLLSSGYVTDQLSRRDFRWAFWLPGGCALLALPALAATFLADDLTVSLASFGVAYFGLMFFSAPTSAMIQFLAPLQLRARATAIYFLITTLVGFGVGPVVAGYASEFFASAGQESLRWALLSTTPVLILSPILLFAAAGRLPQWAREGGTPSASLAPASAR